MKRERNHSKKQERQSRFERDCTALREQGYTDRDCTFGTGGLNAAMLLTVLPVSIAIVALYIWLAHAVSISRAEWIALPVGIILSVPVHELLHAFAWGIANGNFRAVRLGFDGKTFTPYCSCSAPMTRGKYLAGCLFPFVVLGMIPAVLSVVLAKPWLLLFCLCNVFMAGGDTAIAYYALRYAGRGALLLDHPERAGFYAFEKI